MEASQLLQSQNALLEIQSSLLKLDVVATVGDFFKDDAVSWNIEDIDDAEILITLSIM